jgi:EpsI family protein
MRRRDLVLGGMALAGLATAEALRPRRRLILLKKGTLGEALPRQFAGWSSEESTLVSPDMAGRLAKTLYSETVSRTYYNDATGAGVMILIAYGDTQSDLLQLHRPESCYPAVGYTLQSTRAAQLPVAGGLTLPARRVVATTDDRTESILYWTRLGERLPQSAGDQRTARLKNAMEGYVADGVLVRCSTLGDVDQAFKTLDTFVPEMLRAVSPQARPAFVGTRIARAIA